MSRAIELAVKCGAQESRYLVVGAGPDLYALRMTPGQLESFYHATRAEAFREAATELLAWIDPEVREVEDATIRHLAAQFRAMADREGK